MGNLCICNRSAKHAVGTMDAGIAMVLILKDLPTGVIMRTASIKEVIKCDSLYEWHLTDMERVKKLRKPNGHPQPVWFTPF